MKFPKTLASFALLALIASGASLASADEPGPGWYQSRFGRTARCGWLEDKRVIRSLEESECLGGFEYRYVDSGFFTHSTQCMKVVNFGDDENEDIVPVREMGPYYCDRIGKRAEVAIRLFNEGKLVDF